MGDNDKAEFEIGSNGGKVTLTGSTVARLGNSLADLISPFSQALGLAGDHVRIYREQSVQRALERAQEIAAERKEAIKPVNPKNLIQILENASLENDDGMADLWARLILSGDAQFDAELAIFTDTLKRIGRREALLLENLCKTYPSQTPEDPPFKTHFSDILDDHNRAIIEIIFSNLEFISGDDGFDIATSDALSNVNLTVAIITDAESDIEGDTSSFYTNDNYLGNEIAIACLERERLINLKRQLVKSPYGKTGINYYEAALLGTRLMMRCYPERAGKK